LYPAYGAATLCPVSRAATGVYGGQSAEQRRAERRQQLLAAGLDLMGTEGWSATTVRGVCARAKLTSRFFYESFEDLDALAVAVFDEVVEDATARVVDAVAAAPDDPHAQARAAIDTFVRALTDDPRKARVTFIEALGSEALLERRLATMTTFAELIAAQARASYSPPASEDPLVELTARLLTGGLAELLITWLQGEIEIDRERLIDDCVALFVATAEAAAALAHKRSRP
jgi:AcrR family transcriptional regulator